MKTEPHVFSFDDLVKHQISPWEGVRNYQARNYMRDDFALGDEVFIYHSSIKNPGIVGIAEVVRGAYPDPTALDCTSPYYDERSAEKGVSRWCMVDLKPLQRFEKAITLDLLRKEPKLAKMQLLQKGSRLSIQKVSPSEWQYIKSMGSVQRC